MLTCSFLLAEVPIVNLGPISKIELVPVKEFGNTGFDLVDKKPFHGPNEPLRYRIDLYDKNGKLINMKSLNWEEREALKNRLDYKQHDPSSVLQRDEAAGPGSITNMENGSGLFISTYTAIQPPKNGNARIEITTTNPDGKVVKGVKQIGVTPRPPVNTVNTTPPPGGIQPTPISATPITPTPIGATPIEPTNVTGASPDPFFVALGVAGAVGVAGILGAMALQSSLTSQQYILRPSSAAVRNGVVRSSWVGGPYASEQDCERDNQRLFHGFGKCVPQ